MILIFITIMPDIQLLLIFFLFLTCVLLEWQDLYLASVLKHKCHTKEAVESKRFPWFCLQLQRLEQNISTGENLWLIRTGSQGTSTGWLNKAQQWEALFLAAGCKPEAWLWESSKCWGACLFSLSVFGMALPPSSLLPALLGNQQQGESSFPGGGVTGVFLLCLGTSAFLFRSICV